MTKITEQEGLKMVLLHLLEDTPVDALVTQQHAEELASHLANRLLPFLAPLRNASEQALPNQDTAQPCVQDAVIDFINNCPCGDPHEMSPIIGAFIERRKQVGVERYGTVLRTNNGRDALRDAFEESVDLLLYVAQMIMETHDGKLPETNVFHNDVALHRVFGNALNAVDDLADLLYLRDGQLP